MTTLTNLLRTANPPLTVTRRPTVTLALGQTALTILPAEDGEGSGEAGDIVVRDHRGAENTKSAINQAREDI